jgi:NAD(P)-dependent dehydrogenase (short-subunit alcohol dehydrogenase family)
MHVAGATVVVTGGSAGIGLAVVRMLAARGARVLVCDLAAPPAELLREYPLAPSPGSDQRGRVHFAATDVSRPGAIEAALDLAERDLGGPVRALVNNAGIADEGRVEATIQINFAAVVRGTLAMQRREGAGVVVNVASMGGLLEMPMSPIYAGTKAAVVHFSRSAHRQGLAAGSALRINVVCPSFTATALVDKVRRQYGELAQEVLDAEGPLLPPARIAAAILDLIEDDAHAGSVLAVSNKTTSLITRSIAPKNRTGKSRL